jgi:DNA-binding PadR family transcriptional regulator
MHIKRLERLNTKDCLWIYVLGILKSKPMHAYAIREEIRVRFGFRPGTVTAYKVLHKLRKAGLVKNAEDGRRVVYSITPKGRADIKRAIDFYRERIKMLEK